MKTQPAQAYKFLEKLALAQCQVTVSTGVCDPVRYYELVVVKGEKHKRYGGPNLKELLAQAFIDFVEEATKLRRLSDQHGPGSSDPEIRNDSSTSSQQQDHLLLCVDCGKEFDFTQGEQQFFVDKGLLNSPRHCADCRVLLRAFRNGLSGTTTEVLCTDCGVTCRVPFIPQGHRPIFCSRCMRNRKACTGGPGDADGSHRQLQDGAKDLQQEAHR